MSVSGRNMRMDRPSLNSASASLPRSLETILRAQGQTPKKENGRGKGWSKDSSKPGNRALRLDRSVCMCEGLRG